VSLFSAQGDQLFSQAVNGSGTLFIDGSNFGNGSTLALRSEPTLTGRRLIA